MTGHRDDPRTFHIEQDHEGWFIADDYDEEVEDWHTWPAPVLRMTSYRNAEEQLSLMVSEYLENYEPRDPPGFEGGFAANH